MCLQEAALHGTSKFAPLLRQLCIFKQAHHGFHRAVSHCFPMTCSFLLLYMNINVPVPNIPASLYLSVDLIGPRIEIRVAMGTGCVPVTARQADLRAIMASCAVTDAE